MEKRFSMFSAFATDAIIYVTTFLFSGMPPRPFKKAFYTNLFHIVKQHIIMWSSIQPLARMSQQDHSVAQGNRLEMEERE